GTIRNILGGTIFRAPIIISNIPRLVPGDVVLTPAPARGRPGPRRGLGEVRGRVRPAPRAG
ncbi:hypothetical protein, partial [Nocardia farcinica]|uniref:hypothetical protein n=1 Tax=Nocardia farcinica TaxID=37329 RepID=UPI00245726E3